MLWRSVDYTSSAVVYAFVIIKTIVKTTLERSLQHRQLLVLIHKVLIVSIKLIDRRTV